MQMLAMHKRMWVLCDVDKRIWRGVTMFTLFHLLPRPVFRSLALDSLALFLGASAVSLFPSVEHVVSGKEASFSRAFFARFCGRCATSQLAQRLAPNVVHDLPAEG